MATCGAPFELLPLLPLPLVPPPPLRNMSADLLLLLQSLPRPPTRSGLFLELSAAPLLQRTPDTHVSEALEPTPGMSSSGLFLTKAAEVAQMMPPPGWRLHSPGLLRTPSPLLLSLRQLLHSSLAPTPSGGWLQGESPCRYPASAGAPEQHLLLK